MNVGEYFLYKIGIKPNEKYSIRRELFIENFMFIKCLCPENNHS